MYFKGYYNSYCSEVIFISDKTLIFFPRMITTTSSTTKLYNACC